MSMTQKNGAIQGHCLTFINSAATVAVATNTELGEVYCNGVESLGFRLGNAAGGGALDAFIVQFKYHPSGEYVTVASIATDFTNKVFPVVGASASPVTLAAGSDVFIALDVRGVHSVKFLASADTDPASATIEGGGR